MITEEKIREVHKKLKRGEPEGEIKEAMLREGYTTDDIARAFAPHKYDMRTWYLVFGCVFFLVGLWMISNRRSLFGFGTSAFLFIQYYRETERLKREQARENEDN